MKDYTLFTDKASLTQRLGDMSQIAGIRRSFICDGRARDIEALDVVTGGGLEFTLLPGRGMDISRAVYKGLPLSFITKAGLSSADGYEPEGMGWLRGFFGGLLTTCGLSNVGWPCEDEEPQLGIVRHGLHGRISYTGAQHVCGSAGWVDDRYIIQASGTMREGLLHGLNLSMRRMVSTTLGAKSFTLCDEITNDGFTPQPLMLLYHINAGYPLLDESCEMLLPTRGIVGSEAAAGFESDYNRFTPPVLEGDQFVYKHDLGSIKGFTAVALVNHNRELGLFLRFNTAQLGKFMQWKRLSMGDYVVGLEPANCEAVGRVEMRRRGSLDILEPGETKRFELEIGVLDGAEDIEAFRRETAAMS